MTISDLAQKYRGHTPSVLGVREHYAVLVPLVEDGDGVSLLFEVRARRLKRQPGEVCFPGGRVEPGEGVEACALRETEEELGIPPSAVTVLSHLDVIHNQGGFLLHPILARVDQAVVAAMTLSAEEVDGTFLAPLSFFTEHPPLVYTYALKPEVGDDFPYGLIGRRDYDWRGGQVEVPIYNYGPHPIWGMTGRIVRALAES